MKVILNIDALLDKKGEKRYYLVKGLNSNYTVVNRMADNKSVSIKFETIAKLCELLDCTPNELFTLTH